MSEDNKLVKIGEEYGLEENKVQTLLQSYGKYFNEAHELVKGAMDIVVKDATDFETMDLAREKRLALKKVRVEVDKIRKSLKEQALREGRAVDGMANIIKALVEPVEEHLMAQEKFAEELAKQEKANVEQERINKLSKFVDNVEIYKLHPDTMDSQTFDALLKNSEIAHEAQEKAKKEAEAKRLADEKAEKEKQEKIKKENEALKLVIDRQNELAKYGVTSVSVDLSTISDKDYKVILDEAKKSHEAEQKRLADEKAEQEKIQKELEDKKKAEADRLAKEKEEAEKQAEIERQNALAPDKEKILMLADELTKIEVPAVKDEKAMQILVNFKEAIKNIEADLRESVKEL